jgi:hypothetical protein
MKKRKWTYWLHRDKTVLCRVRGTEDQVVGLGFTDFCGVYHLSARDYKRAGWIRISESTARRRFPTAFASEAPRPDASNRHRSMLD